MNNRNTHDMTWEERQALTPRGRLKNLISAVLPLEDSEQFVSLIEEMISDECRDTENRINISGNYDPDYWGEEIVVTYESMMTIFISGMGLIMLIAALFEREEAKRYKRGSFYHKKAQISYYMLGGTSILMLVAVPVKLLLVGD